MLKKNKQSSLNLSILTLLGFAFFLGLILRTSSPSANINFFHKQENINPRLSTSANKPVRLKIPQININAAVEYVGLTSEGAMDVPKGPAEVAWYMLGQQPGEIGSAVIAGHSGYKDNRPAVFDNLYKLKKGDKIYVEDERGEIITFVVRASRRYDPKANPPEVFNSDDKKSHLNLITCTGLWDKVEKTHSDRLVVFTDKVDATNSLPKME